MEGSKGILTCGTYGFNPKVYLNDRSKFTRPKHIAPLVDNGMASIKRDGLTLVKKDMGHIQALLYHKKVH